MTGKVYKSRGDIQQGETTVTEVFKTSLSRPWVLLFLEPIVLLLSIYMAIIYGTLYLCFGAFPIVYQQGRGWSPGIGGLAFLGVAVGMLIAVGYAIWDNKRYAKVSDKNQGFAPPEARLPLCMIGSIAVPIGLFWFAWTNSPSIHWSVSIIAAAPFGFGMVLIFLGIMNYLIDAYTIFAASVLAANSVLRSLFGAAFPLFTRQMFDRLGIHWASSIPAFLALACVPFPFLFYKYGDRIRANCKYAAQSEQFMKQMMNKHQDPSDEDEEGSDTKSEKEKSENDVEENNRRQSQAVEEVEQPHEAVEHESDAEDGPVGQSRFVPITRTTTTKSQRERQQQYYNDSPFDLDRINTRESFKKSASTRSRASSLSDKKR